MDTSFIKASSTVPGVVLFHEQKTNMTANVVCISGPTPLESKDIRILESQSVETQTLEEHGADEQRLIHRLELRLQETVKRDTAIDYKTFKSVFKVKDTYFGERFFQLIDTDGSGSVEVSELLAALKQIIYGSSYEKLKFLFDIYDQSGDGTIDIEELRQALKSCMVESSVKLGDEELDMLTQALFDDADVDKSGSITFDELQKVIEKNPGVKENLNLSVEQWLTQETKPKRARHRYLTRKYFINNPRKIAFFFSIIAINIALFAVGCWNYRHSNWWIVFARGGGLCLDFDCSFIVVLMLRKCMTWLRATPAHMILPLDQNIMFHKLVGFLILFFTVEHTLMHIGNAVLVAESDFNVTIPEFIFTTKANVGWVAGFAPLSGVLLVIILVVIVICSMPFVRRTGSFEVFYITHMLYVPFWILTILHATHFWKWFLVPGVLFVLEKIFRSKIVRRMRHGNSYIKEVNLLPSEVTHLVISRPEGMRFRPGDYIFLQIPAIAKYEWHPFTISSAPEMDDHMWLHVRSAGSWTKKLYDFFNSMDQRKLELGGQINKGMEDGKPEMTRSTSVSMDAIRLVSKFAKNRSFKSQHSTYRRRKDMTKMVNVKCFIDGPYGTSSRSIFEAEHAVLIGSGIGVTPFASILQSIMYRFKAFKRCCPQCNHTWYGEIPKRVMNLKKVDFIWINRDQKCFEWFVSLLTQLELEQTLDGGLGGFLEMHMFMTAALNKTDLKGLGLQMALDLIHKDQQKDLLTGLKTRTQPGRPNFQKLFTKIASEKKGNVKVFFCGNPLLARTIKHYCEQFGFQFHKENF